MPTTLGTGTRNSFFGSESGRENTTGSSNSFFGFFAGLSNTTGRYNVFIGDSAGSGNSTGSFNTVIGYNANLGGGNLNFATAIGSYAITNASDTIVLGKVAGTYDGVARPADTVQIPGILSTNNVFKPGILSSNPFPCNAPNRGFLYFNSTVNALVFCDGASWFSLERGGLVLRPAKNDSTPLTSENSAMFKQIRQQQTQVEQLQEQVKEQQALIDGLKKLLCANNPNADICK
jgi:hypothetical protein